MTACRVSVIVTNTKGKDFRTQGKLWADGTLRVDNPRPKKYSDEFLVMFPGKRCKLDPKRLYWLETNESEIGELSPFRLKSMLMVMKKPKRH